MTMTLTLMTRSFSLITIMSLLAGCSTAPPATQPSATTQSSPTAQSPVAQANRIVSLNSLSTDIVSQLDKNKLVGVTGSSF